MKIFPLLIKLSFSVFYVAALTGCNPSTTTPTTAPAEEQSTKQLTLADYEAIANGITLEEARKTLGSNGKQMSSSDLAGIKTEIYIWENTPPTSNMTLTFQNGKMVSKAQFGLK